MTISQATIQSGGKKKQDQHFRQHNHHYKANYIEIQVQQRTDERIWPEQGRHCHHMQVKIVHHPILGRVKMPLLVVIFWGGSWRT